MDSIDKKVPLPLHQWEINIKMDKRSRVAFTKYEITREEKKDILDNLGLFEFNLYQYYLRMAAIGESFMEDADAFNYFSKTISIRKIGNARRALEKADYFKKKSFVASDGTKSITYYIGQERVNETK